MFKRKKAPPPEWAPFEDAGDWHAFETLVSQDAGARGWTGDIREGILTDGKNKFGLGNLAQMCADQPHADWPDQIQRHFDVCAAFDDSEEQFDNRGEARVALRARLLDDEFLASLEQAPLARRVCDDLQLVLAFDLPDSVMVVPREEVLKWGPEEELFDLALEQTMAERELELERMDLPIGESDETVPVFALYGDSFFTATHALWADEFDPPSPEHGVLLAVPTRHTVFAHPIRDDSVIGAVTHLMQIAQDFAARGPGTLSSHLYWVRDGEWERQQAEIEGDRLIFTPGPGFTELLNELA